MHPQLEKDINELVEMARNLDEPRLFSELTHLRAIATQEYGRLVTICGEEAFDYIEPKNSVHSIPVSVQVVKDLSWTDETVKQVNRTVQDFLREAERKVSK